MPLYHELRVKWSVFHRLLALTNRRLRYGTPGLGANLRRRQELLLDYSNLLRERGKYSHIGHIRSSIMIYAFEAKTFPDFLDDLYGL